MRQRVGRLLLFALFSSIATACGGHPQRLGDGVWYGKFMAMNVAQRTTTFVPACRFSHGRWTATSRDSIATAISPRADLEIYYRPSGSAAAGHVQSANLKLLANAALRGRPPDSPSGWFVTARHHVAVSISEDSGVNSSAGADQRTFACVRSSSTRAFVSR